jgi:FkbM family methyltransferase
MKAGRSARVVDRLLRAVPGREGLLTAAALAPPGWRSASFHRVCSALAQRTTFSRATLQTNLGIHRDLRCDVAASNGIALFGRPGHYVGERAPLALAARLSQACDTFLDVGANLGYFTFLVNAEGRRDLPIHAFEPDETLARRLTENVRRNGLTSVVVHQCAVGAIDGEATFYANESDPLSGSLTTDFAGKHDVRPTAVRVERFSTIADRLGFRAACAKVDVEGAEFDFMAGAIGALDRIQFLVIEVLAPAHHRSFVPALMAAGAFQAYYIDDFSLEHSVDGSFRDRPSEYNWLFCRKTPDALRERLRGTPFSVVPAGQSGKP